MANTFDTSNFNKTITDGLTNSGTPTKEEIGDGIKYNSYSDSVIVNKFLYNISSAIKYIQEKGMILWQKGKFYNLGSIVYIIEFNESSYIIRKFRYISNTSTNEQPVVGTLNIDNERKVLYFNSISGVNLNYWEEVFDEEIYNSTINIPEETKGLLLFNIPENGYNRVNADVIIKRYNTNTSNWDSLRYTFNFECFNFNNNLDNCLLTIYNVICNNYDRTSYTPSAINDIISPDENEYIFGKNKFALLGITMSIQRNGVYIDIYSDQYAYIDRRKNIQIDIKVNETNILFLNNPSNTYNGYTGRNVVVINEGYNNSGTDCGYIIETPFLLTKEEQFKKSLLHITSSNCMNGARRPGYSNNFSYSFDPNTLFNVINDNTNTDYSNHVLPRINGTLYPDTTSTSYGNRNFSAGSTPLLIGWVSRNGTNSYYVPDDMWMSSPYTQNQMKSTVLMESSNRNDNIFLSKQPELNIFNQNPKLFPRSKKVYRYFKY